MDWEFTAIYRDGNDQISASNILNIITNFIPDKTITCDDRCLPWINDFIKSLICAKDNFYKKLVRKVRKCTIFQFLKTSETVSVNIFMLQIKTTLTKLL